MFNCLCFIYYKPYLHSTINDAIFLCGGTTTDSAETCVSELHMFDTGGQNKNQSVRNALEMAK